MIFSCPWGSKAGENQEENAIVVWEKDSHDLNSGLGCQHLARARETIAEVSSQWLAVNIGFDMERPARLSLQFDSFSMKQQTPRSFRKEEQ